MANVTTLSVDANANRPTDLQVRLKYSQSEKDDWTKVEDKAVRKKIQDRLAKRKSRTSHRVLPKDEIDSLVRNERTKRQEKDKERADG